jgi:hypothetical protein
VTREEQVAHLVGMDSVLEIACELGISPRTVKDRKRRAAYGLQGKRLDVLLVRSICRPPLPVASGKIRLAGATYGTDGRGMTNQEIAESIGNFIESVPTSCGKYSTLGGGTPSWLDLFWRLVRSRNLIQCRALSVSEPHDKAEHGEHNHEIDEG